MFQRPSARAALAATALITILTACSSAPTPAGGSPAPSSVSQPSTAPGSVAPSPSVEPSADPTSSPVATPPPAKPVAWADPKAVDLLEGCLSVVPTVDADGGIHLAAACEDGLRYATTRDGSRWTGDKFATPAGRDDIDPQVAVSGDTVIFAFSRTAPEEGGCGDDGMTDLGVYVRTRKLDQDVWSPATRVGAAGDRLQSIRYVDGTIHATVVDSAGKPWYERVAGGDAKRFRLNGATGAAAVRVGNDGVARVVFESADGLRLATVGGSSDQQVTIPDTKDGLAPSFVLGTDSTAYVLWTRNNALGGCAEPDPIPSNGTYFSSNLGSAWTTEKLSDRLGVATLTVDPGTSELHAIVGDFAKVEYLHKTVLGKWTKGAALPIVGNGSSFGIRQNPVSGDLFVVYVMESSDTDGGFSVMVITEK
jgi:hypothetical protein